MTTTPTPAAIFASLARQMPASKPQKAASPQIGPHPIENTCLVCGTPLQPGRIHVPGGFECRQALGAL